MGGGGSGTVGWGVVACAWIRCAVGGDEWLGPWEKAEIRKAKAVASQCKFVPPFPVASTRGAQVDDVRLIDSDSFDFVEPREPRFSPPAASN